MAGPFGGIRANGVNSMMRRGRIRESIRLAEQPQSGGAAKYSISNQGGAVCVAALRHRQAKPESWQRAQLTKLPAAPRLLSAAVSASTLKSCWHRRAPCYHQIAMETLARSRDDARKNQMARMLSAHRPHRHLTAWPRAIQHHTVPGSTREICEFGIRSMANRGARGVVRICAAETCIKMASAR